MPPLTKPITPHLWFDTQAKEASEFYCSVFPDSRVDRVQTLKGTPSGDCDVVSFTLSGMPFQAISGGPYFTFNPSVSFMVNYDPAHDPKAREHLDEAWAKLSAGGAVLMPLGEYPFSRHYGWVVDRYGVSWQLILTNPDGEPRPFIIPSLLFVSAEGEQAEAATDFYMSVFADSKRGALARYPSGMAPNKAGAVMFTDFTLNGQWFVAMDGSDQMHHFKFSEAVSFIVSCNTQAEIDYYWEKLSAVPESEQCGWLKDRYGLCWQIVPTRMDEMMAEGTPAQIERVTQAFLGMKKFDITALERAFADAV